MTRNTHDSQNSADVSAPTAGITPSLLTTADEHHREVPLSPQMDFFLFALDRFIAGSLCLLGGMPGSCKSLMTTQIAIDLARAGERSLFILTEQSAGAMKKRAMQMTSDMEPADAARLLEHIHVESSVLDVTALPAYVAREVLSPAGRHHGVSLIVLDSIQGEGLPSAATHAYGKVLEFGRLCCGAGITTILVSHITKRGEIAGPKTLEHGVDAVLVLRRAMLCNLLAVRKNRFGPVTQRPIPLTIDPLTTRLMLAPHAEARPGGASTYSGSATGLTQVQASVSVPPDGRPGKMTAPGLPRREIEQLIDCIGQIDNIDFSDLDYRVQCRVPRGGQYVNHLALPLCMALVASYARKELPSNYLYLGEIDLFRKVLDVPAPLLESLMQAIDAGEIRTPLTLFVPIGAAEHLPSSSRDMRIVLCSTLEDSIYQTWPELR